MNGIFIDGFHKQTLIDGNDNEEKEDVSEIRTCPSAMIHRPPRMHQQQKQRSWQWNRRVVVVDRLRIVALPQGRRFSHSFIWLSQNISN
jgi:hypothetical protein